jgi:predicted ATPase/DNA-binding winged helix-turn-helix (wHTH) protein
MSRQHQTDAAVLFGPFALYPTARLLERDGAAVHIGGRALDILIALAERAGEVVSKRDLIARVWSGLNVDEGSLRFHITALRKVLGDGLSGARYVTNVPGRGYCLVAPISDPPTQPLSKPEPAFLAQPQTLPARLARMIGRDDVVQTIAEALSTHRFVSIVGPGGIGKTTVVTAAAHELLTAFSGQVVFVDLGPLNDQRLVPGVVASALGVTGGPGDPLASLTASVYDRRVLLILDGCEHVIESVAVVTETLSSTAPSIHILVTSRESLRVEGEHVHRLFPLQCPPQSDELSVSDVLNFPAAQLFLERVTATSGGLELTDADAPALAGICHRLDGIPLALELAAARAGTFGIRGLALLLDDQLLLTTRGRRTAIPRHQTLKATLDWSYEGLSAEEKLLLNRLSVFKGTFDIVAASDICSDDRLPRSTIPDAVFDLVSKSLLSASHDAVTSYRLLDTTRSYASEKLNESGERELIAEHHARHVCTRFENAARQWVEKPSDGWLATYRPQIDNLRAALNWAFSEKGDATLGVTLTLAAVPLWSQLSLVDEFLGCIERALLASNRLPNGDRRNEMQLHAELGGLQMYAVSSVKQSNSAWETALTLATELGELDYQLRALRALWAEAINGGEFRQALSLAERFQRLALQAGSEDDQIVSDRLVGTAQHFLGDQSQAHAAIERMLDRYVSSAARAQVVRFQFNQKVSARLIRGRILWLQGLTNSAMQDIHENVAEALSLEHTFSLCNVLTQSACPVALLAGDFDTARRYVELLRQHTKPRALDIWHSYAVCFAAALDIEDGQVETGLARLQSAMEELRRSGFGHYRTSFLTMRARGLLLLGRVTDAKNSIEEALSICERTGERWCLPELHRMTGEIALAMRLAGSVDAAVEAFDRALEVAREQQALAWELRAANSKARCLAGDERLPDALTALDQIYSRFREGHDTPELMDAGSLLPHRNSPAPGS